jgi:hypothetical protein
LRLRVEFETPYEDQWCPAKIDRDILLSQGETLTIGEVRFQPALKAQVLVVGPDGKPVEGVPTRRQYGSRGAWCVPHNTDAEGLAHFFVHPNSKGNFRVSDFPTGSQEGRAANLVVPFHVGDTLETDQAFKIQITARQIELLLGSRGK